jgi:proteasome assembly chaperone (PAC2) family protein
MPIEHIIYIPAVLLLGMTVGYVLGARAVREEHAKMKRRAKE